MIANPVLSLIVAKSRNGVIGVDGDLPWRLSSDLKLFKRVTLGKPCLMGRVTRESLPFALPGRPNLVLTRNPGYTASKSEIFTDLHAMVGRGYELAGAMNVDEIMLIGGAQLYARLMPYIGRMYITEVDAMIEGNAHFPAILAAEWREIQSVDYPKGEKDDYPFAAKIYERRK